MNENEVTIDVSDLQPPEPMEIVLDRLDKIEDGQYIRMIHRMQPYPLYNILMDNGFRYKVDETQSLLHIYIWKGIDKLAEKHIKENFLKTQP